MKLTARQFKDRIKEINLYRWCAESYRNQSIYIPKAIPVKYLLVKYLLLSNIKVSIIHDSYDIPYKYITKVKKTLYKLCYAERAYYKLVSIIKHKQKLDIASHLIKTCGGCAVYFRYKRPKINTYIIEKHLEQWSPDEIYSYLEGLSLNANPNDKVRSTKKYIKYVIRMYEKSMNLLYLPKRQKTNRLLI